MQKFKLLTAFFLCFALMFTAASCSSSADDAPPAESSSSVSIEESAPASTAEVSQAAPSPSPEESKVSEEVIYEENDIKISFSGIEDSMFGPEINLYIENNSKDNITVQVRDFSINGIMIDPIFFKRCRAG